MNDAILKEFVDAYIAAALWASNDEDDNPLDENYSAEDFHPESLRKIQEDCRKFLEKNETDIMEGYKGGHNKSVAQAGIDFFLTRNGHGAGFWDGDWETRAADRLTQASHDTGEQNLYTGSDEKIYLE